MKRILDALRGIGVDHPVVGFARGLLESFFLGGLATAAAVFEVADLSVLGLPSWAIPVILWAYPTVKRTAEAYGDKIDPKTPRNPQT